MIVPPVYAITDRQVSGCDDPAEIARRLFAVGVRWVQIREKDLPDRELLSAVERADAARPPGSVLLVNDRVDIARLAGVGVHLGEDDLPPALARKILGDGAVLGVSTHDLEAARRAFETPEPDYVAFGPVFQSATKTLRPPRGLDELARVASVKTRPLVAVGGIGEQTLGAVLDAGADSAAMVGALLARGEIEENARRLLDFARRRSRPGRIYLVGFMGSGKTTIGRRLAERLGVAFVDLDEEIERTSGRTVRALFEDAGEGTFRERESVFLEGTAALEDVVVATGGGSFVSERNRRTIGALGRAVFLNAPLPVLLSRLSGKQDRPLFRGPEQAAALFAERAPFYRMAPIRVDLQEQSVEVSADRVLGALFDPTPPRVSV